MSHADPPASGGLFAAGDRDGDSTVGAGVDTDRNLDRETRASGQSSMAGSAAAAAAAAAASHLRLSFNISRWSPTRDEWILANRLVQRDEAERISAFVFKRDAKASMAGRLLMRRCLADSLQRTNTELNLTRTSDGRPILASPVVGFDFNASHQGDFSVVTSGRCERIGVDVMEMRYTGGRRVAEFFRLMRKQFTRDEWRFVETPLVESQQVERFYRLWTLKESYVKAVGVGLGMDLQRINFRICDELRLGNELASTSVEVDGRLAAEWTFHECLLDAAHCVATASVGLQRQGQSFSLPCPVVGPPEPLLATGERQQCPPQTAATTTSSSSSRTASNSANAGCYVQMVFNQMVRGLDPRDELNLSELTKLWEEFRMKEERPSL